METATVATATVVVCRTEDSTAHLEEVATAKAATVAVVAVVMAVAVEATIVAMAAAVVAAVTAVAVEAILMVAATEAPRVILVVVAVATAVVEEEVLLSAIRKTLCSWEAWEMPSSTKSNRYSYQVTCSQYAFVC